MSDPVFIDLVDHPIDLPSLFCRLEDPDVGAHGWFIGVTRRTTRAASTTGETDARITQTLSYQAHHEMARRELLKLAVVAVEKFGLTKITLVHRLGEVPIGEASVVVGCSSPHRPATFEALPWVMDVLKRDVPIWKREQYADQTSEWVHPLARPESHDST